MGENLQDHLQIRCAYKVQGVKTMNERFQSLVQRAGFAAQYALTRRGPMTMAPSQLGAFVQVRPEPRDAQPRVSRAAADAAEVRRAARSVPGLHGQRRQHPPDQPRLGAHHSARTRGAPEIRPNYLATAEDRHVAAESVRVTRNIVSMPALAKYRPEEFRPGLEFQSDEELAKAAGDISTTIFHPVGTCKMGSDEAAVVDPRLKVRGLAGLRVADASVMPTITSGNTNSPTLMIAEKAAAMIAGGRGRTSGSCHRMVVMVGLVPTIHHPLAPGLGDWILGTSPRMTPNSVSTTI